MIKDHEYLSLKASYCLDIAKKLGATDSSVFVGNSISETVNFRNQKLDESNRSDNLAIGITTYIGKKKVIDIFFKFIKRKSSYSY